MGGLDKVYIKVDTERGSKIGFNGQRWSRGYKARGQEHKKISEAKDSPSEDRPFLGQAYRRKCFPKKKIIIIIIRFLKVFFSQPEKKGLQNNFSGDLQKTK